MQNEKPIFMQIIEMIENDILNGIYGEDELIISTPQISKLLSVNPTTAQRAITVLSDRGIVCKKRGVGMAVTSEAKAMILKERQEIFFKQTIISFIKEARTIGISDEKLLQLIKENLDD